MRKDSSRNAILKTNPSNVSVSPNRNIKNTPSQVNLDNSKQLKSKKNLNQPSAFEEIFSGNPLLKQQ